MQNNIKEIPKIITAVNAIGDGFSSVVFITNINKPANDKIAPNKCVKPFIGSLAYLAIICIPPLYINLILIDTLILV